MYPVYLEAARLQGEKGDERSFCYALEAGKMHVKVFREIKQHVDKSQDRPPAIRV